MEQLTDTEATQILLENSEDAYGFPPYPDIKHLLYQTRERDLRPLEQCVVAKAVAGLPAVLLRSSNAGLVAENAELHGPVCRFRQCPRPAQADARSRGAICGLAGVLAEPVESTGD